MLIGWCASIDCTRKWIGNAAYIVYVTSYIKVMPGYFLKLLYFLHKHQMKATKNSQAYTVGTHECV